MQGDLLEIRCAERILTGAGANRVETEGGEHIPRRRLSVVLITAVAVGLGVIEAVHHLTHPVLRFPRLPSVVVEVDGMLDGLVDVGVVAHIHNLHLPDFVDDLTVIAVVEDWRKVEHRVEHGAEVAVAAMGFA